MKKLIFLTLTLSLLCCGHKAEKKETYKAAETAKQKNAEEQFNLANSYCKNGDYVKAVEYYRKAAEQGLAEAQFDLGLMYEKGNGVTKDYVKAIEYYRKAAEQGLAEAQFDLGLMYEKGNGVTKDYVKAIEYYRKAAEQGFALAQASLGSMYFDGKGVPKDYVQSYKWLNIASIKRDGKLSENSSEMRDLIEKIMTPEQIAKAQKESQEFKVKH